jgi:hypothetical protein
VDGNDYGFFQGSWKLFPLLSKNVFTNESFMLTNKDVFEQSSMSLSVVNRTLFHIRVHQIEFIDVEYWLIITIFPSHSIGWVQPRIMQGEKGEKRERGEFNPIDVLLTLCESISRPILRCISPSLFSLPRRVVSVFCCSTSLGQRVVFRFIAKT